MSIENSLDELFNLFKNPIFRCSTCNKEFKNDRALRSHMNWHSEDYRKAHEIVDTTKAVEKNKQKSLDNIQKYLENPKRCNNCNSELSYGKRYNKFCSKSCSNSYNSKNRSEDYRKKHAKKVSETLKRKNAGKVKKIVIKKQKVKIVKEKLNACNTIINEKIFKPKYNYEKFQSDMYRTNEKIDLLNLDASEYLISDKFICDNIDEKLSATSLVSLKFYLKNDTFREAILFRNFIVYLIYYKFLSPNEIKLMYDFIYSELSMFIKITLGIKNRKLSDALNNYLIKNNKNNTDEKSIYYGKCKFSFDPYLYSNIEGYDLLLERGMYNIKNKNGVTRDHILSIYDGYVNNISPEIISHPANCRFISMPENSSKSSNSLLNESELINRIKSWNENNFDKIYMIRKNKKSKYLQRKRKSNILYEQTKQKISESIKKLHKENPYIFITNGLINKRHSKYEPIPEGFRQGVTRNLKK